MLLLTSIVLLVLWTTLMMNIYSVFNPFIENLWDIKDYNIAYYWALSSVERAELSLRHHEAWFEWTWGWIGGTNLWPASDYNDKDDFDKAWKRQNWMYRNISSRISWNAIPETWNSNIEPALRWADSEDYNKLDYNMSEEFLLYYDDSSYTWNSYWKDPLNIKQTEPKSIEIDLRLPPEIEDKLGSLADGIDIDWDWITNDIIVNRSLFGNDQDWDKFQVIPTISVDYENSNIDNSDTAIRENIVWDTMNFWPDFTPNNNSDDTYLSSHNILPENSSFSGENFEYVFSNWTWLHLKLSLVNLMKDLSDNLYPFLEYKITLDTTKKISDRFFHINGFGKIWKYKVKIKIDKPVVESSASSDFTIIF